MKKNVKAYLTSLGFSSVAVIVSWLIYFMFGSVGFGFDFLCIGALSGIMISIIVICTHINSKKTRLILILLSPSLYYLFVLIFLTLVLISDDWNMFASL
jgi:hypothetical protein